MERIDGLRSELEAYAGGWHWEHGQRALWAMRRGDLDQIGCLARGSREGEEVDLHVGAAWVQAGGDYRLYDSVAGYWLPRHCAERADPGPAAVEAMLRAALAAERWVTACDASAKARAALAAAPRTRDDPQAQSFQDTLTAAETEEALAYAAADAAGRVALRARGPGGVA